MQVPGKLKYHIFAWCFIIVVFMAVKIYLIPLVNQKKENLYSPAQISELEKSIKTSVPWQEFHKIFPQSITLPAMPNYYPQGESFPIFLCGKDIYYEGDLSIDVWLFARVEAREKTIAFKHCVLRIYFKKNGAAFNTATLNKTQTEDILQVQSQKEFIEYLKTHFFDPATFTSH